jgi:hypothetical protein
MIICTGTLPWIVLDLLQWKTQCLFTYIRSSFVNHYFPVESQKLYLSRHGFVNVQNWKNSKVTLANANSAQTVLYFFLLMLYRASTCKIFWLNAVVFFTIFIHLKETFKLFFNPYHLTTGGRIPKKKHVSVMVHFD